MRIAIQGEGPSAKAIRGYLQRHDFHVTGHEPDYTVAVEDAEGGQIVLDSVAGELEAAVLRYLRRLTATPIAIHTAGGVQSDRAVRIGVPPVEEDRKAVEMAVFRALLQVGGQQPEGHSRRGGRSWWKNWGKR